MTAVLEHSRKGGSHFVVLLVVASYSDENGEWRINQATLRKRARLGQRRVQQILAELIAGGELEVVPGDGRGKFSTYRLLVGSAQKGEADCTLSTQKGEADCTLSLEKGEEDCTLSTQKGEADCTLSPKKDEADCTLSAGSFPPTPPLSPVRKKEEAEESYALGLRPLTAPQRAAHQVRVLLEEAGVAVPSPAQIGVWVKAAGGLEALLSRLDRLITAGLATKDDPVRYVHRVVTEEARRGESGFRPKPAPGGRAGVDERRRLQALRLLGKGGGA